MLIPRRIVPADWPWIQDWFTDERLNAELGPLDVEWLEYVLADPGGVELVVTDPAAPQVPLALVGVVWATAEHPHTITDLAVSPALRGSGIGRRALAAVLSWDAHPPGGDWVSYVATDNPAADAFFRAVGWHPGEVDDGMRVYSAPRQRGVE
ncbi:N-acetyltransferase [Leucobacter sp. 7(1)]|uniref:GNAT family N-acetyltransferase n=1 Tax=Leucobacter sp. 7(1) TaxID=1255613 RepID=UPI001C3C6CD5|nr:GNAT family N-acetyltransferase [Leucobacter sp. 7(1)]